MDIRDGFIDSIGNTPLIKLHGRLRGDRLQHLRQGGVPQSRRLGEGSRGARHHRGRRESAASSRPGGVIVEGTAGNTGIGIALVANARGYRIGDRDARDAEPGKEGHAAAVRRRSARWSRRCPTPIPATTCAIPSGWPRNWPPRNRTARSGPTSSTTSPTAMATTAPPARRSGTRPTARSTASPARSAPAARWPASALALQGAQPDRSRSGWPTRWARRSTTTMPRAS